MEEGPGPPELLGHDDPHEGVGEPTAAKCVGEQLFIVAERIRRPIPKRCNSVRNMTAAAGAASLSRSPICQGPQEARGSSRPET